MGMTFDLLPSIHLHLFFPQKLIQGVDGIGRHSGLGWAMLIKHPLINFYWHGLTKGKSCEKKFFNGQCFTLDRGYF